MCARHTKTKQSELTILCVNCNESKQFRIIPLYSRMLTILEWRYSAYKIQPYQAHEFYNKNQLRIICCIDCRLGTTCDILTFFHLGVPFYWFSETVWRASLPRRSTLANLLRSCLFICFALKCIRREFYKDLLKHA